MTGQTTIAPGMPCHRPRARSPSTSLRGGAWLLVLLLSTPALADNPDPQPVPLFTAIEPYLPTPPGYRQAWRIAFNHEQIRQPAAAIRVDIPGLPAFVATIDFWSARAGYLDAPNPKHPTGLQQIPDPMAPPEAFSWRWYAQNALSLTVHEGFVAGTVVHGARWFRITPRADYTLLAEPTGSVGPPWVPPQPVPGMGATGIALLVLLLGLRAMPALRSGRDGGKAG